MGQFLFYAEQHANTQASASSAAEIQGALNAVTGFQDNSCNITVGGSWVGSPRITRVAGQDILSLSTSRNTRVAWLFQYPDQPGGASDTTIQNCITSLADLQLTQLGAGWQPSQALSYNPGTNGSVDWWSSGQAAATHTKDAFDLNQQTGGTSTIENPTGPQNATGPLDLFGGATGVTAQILPFLTTAMYFIAGGVVLYFAWPLLTGARDMASAPQRRDNRVYASTARARNNPRRSSRRSRR